MYGSNAYDDDEDVYSKPKGFPTKNKSHHSSKPNKNNCNTNNSDIYSSDTKMHNFSNHSSNNGFKVKKVKKYNPVEHQRRSKYDQRSKNTSHTQNSAFTDDPEYKPQIQTHKERIQALRVSSNAALDRSIMCAVESENIGMDTAEKLHHQRKQLENIDQMLHETNEDLDQTQHTITGMKSIFGAIGNFFTKAPKTKAYNKPVGQPSKTKSMIKHQQRNSNNNNNNSAMYEQKRDAVDDEFHEKLDILHSSVKRMKMMAEGVNDELGAQDVILKSIDSKMDKVDTKLKSQNRQMRKIR